MPSHLLPGRRGSVSYFLQNQPIQPMKSALVTGANKGIGLEVATLLAQRGFFVYFGSRRLASGEAAVQQLRAAGLPNLAAVQLDVTSPDSIRAARAAIGAQTATLDVLVNNAGISGGTAQSVRQATPEQFQTVFETNVFGVAGVTQAFLDLLAAAPQPRIVNVSSAMASLTLSADLRNDNRLPVYQASKAALNITPSAWPTSCATRPSRSMPCAPATPKPTLRATRAPAR
jgi:NAD(P)-dependent dehydrogenase (short-subunit alcohol dehydrogenase family)